MLEKSAAPQVSIIIPVYNSEPYLRRCLNSIQAQTLKEWECICVDDGSTDGSGAILDEYVARDERFVVIHKENGGVSAARNAGMEIARGEYIGFSDHDDWMEAETYELALNAARRADADLVQWAFVAEGKNGNKPSKELPEGFFSIGENPEYFTVVVWCKLFKKSLVFENQIAFPPAAKMGGEDICFSLIAYTCAKKCFYLNRALYYHDLTHESLGSRKQNPAVISDYGDVLKTTCDRVTEIIDKKKIAETERQNISFILFCEKVKAKNAAFICLSQPDCRLFRTVFPELNRQMLRYFFKTKRPYMFIMVLATWHLDALAVALLRLKQWKKALKAKFRAKS